MIRVILIALAFLALTLVLLPFQLIGLAFDLRLQRTIPHLYHRVLCALIGVRIREVGRRSTPPPRPSRPILWSCLPDASLPPRARWWSFARTRSRGWPWFAGPRKFRRPSSSNRQ